MKKLILLGMLPLSLALFSFVTDQTTGVYNPSGNIYQIASDNTISAQDCSTICSALADMYGITMKADQNYQFSWITFQDGSYGGWNNSAQNANLGGMGVTGDYPKWTGQWQYQDASTLQAILYAYAYPNP